MNKTSLVLGLSALAITGAILAPKAVLAYRGDPSVKGPSYTEERHTAMTQAFEKNDYEAWKALMTGKGKVIQVVNAQNFARFAEAHRLALAGKTQEAAAIRTELGLGLRNGSGMGQGMGYGRTNR